jgi:hypothetical protein
VPLKLEPFDVAPKSACVLPVASTEPLPVVVVPSELFFTLPLITPLLSTVIVNVPLSFPPAVATHVPEYVPANFATEEAGVPPPPPTKSPLPPPHPYNAIRPTVKASKLKATNNLMHNFFILSSSYCFDMPQSDKMFT